MSHESIRGWLCLQRWSTTTESRSPLRPARDPMPASPPSVGEPVRGLRPMARARIRVSEHGEHVVHEVRAHERLLLHEGNERLVTPPSRVAAPPALPSAQVGKAALVARQRRVCARLSIRKWRDHLPFFQHASGLVGSDRLYGGLTATASGLSVSARTSAVSLSTVPPILARGVEPRRCRIQ
jgi:hypothetical protein